MPVARRSVVGTGRLGDLADLVGGIGRDVECHAVRSLCDNKQAVPVVLAKRAGSPDDVVESREPWSALARRSHEQHPAHHPTCEPVGTLVGFEVAFGLTVYPRQRGVRIEMNEGLQANRAGVVQVGKAVETK